MEKINKRKGITLISLVITIILILILAGITISILLNNGIMDKAKFAKEQYANAQQGEIQDMDSVSNEIDNILNNVTTVGTRNQNANNYSTDEQVIGTWIDGKKLYRKVYQATTPTTSSDRVTLVDTTNLNIDAPVDLYGYIIINDAGDCDRLNMYYTSTDFISTQFCRNRVSMYVNHPPRQGKPCVIIIEYTKITDTATNN